MIVGLSILGVVVLLFMFLILPGFVIIGATQVGIVTRKNFGTRLPEGHIIACNGEIGIQADTLMPGFYWRFPILWSIKKQDVILIKPGQIGLVTSVDGKVIPSGRLLGDEVECDSFQNAKQFLMNGYRGAQIGILKPGTYRINTLAFKVDIRDATKVVENEIGVAIALDGIPLPTGYVIAPRPIKDGKVVAESSFFQDGQGFIDSYGYRGAQLDTLQPGEYYINKLLFDVKVYKIADIQPGYVAVIRSNVGTELDKDSSKPSDSLGEGRLMGQIHDASEGLLTTDKDKRGIWKEPIAPGKYNLNPIAYTSYLVPTSAVTIDWAAEGRIDGDNKRSIQQLQATLDDEGVLYKFNPLKVTSKDGFQLEVNVRMVIRIQPANAAFIIARFGSVANLIDQIVHPLIDSSFRNKAGEKKAIDFFQSRTELQKEALEHARETFADYNVEAQNLLIAYIDIPDNLLDTQTQKEIALQQQTQYDEQAKAQDRRIAVEEKSARAEKQKEVIAAKLEIDIKGDKAIARIKEAEGEAAYLRQTNAASGIGLAEGYSKQKEALGEEGTAFVNIITKLAEHNLKFVPEVQVGSNGNDLGNLINIMAGKYAKDMTNKKDWSKKSKKETEEDKAKNRIKNR